MMTKTIVHINHVQDRIINLTDKVLQYRHRWGRYPSADNRAVLESTEDNLKMYKRILRSLQYEPKNSK